MFRTKVMMTKKPKALPSSSRQPVTRRSPSIEGLTCTYPHRICMRNRLDGYSYCIHHILEDKNAPYRQCNFYYQKSGRRCPNATLKHERKEGLRYCHLHLKRASLLSRQRIFRKKKQAETPESLLEELDHYNVARGVLDLASDIPNEQSSLVLSRLPLNAPQNRIGRIIDYTSDSDSDADQTIVEHAWRGHLDSDAESVDSEQEDPLKHAGVYTAEEVALITRDKLIRLQSLYIEQFKRLQHVLREKRRNYIHAVRMEKESQGSIHASMRLTSGEADDYKMLKALHRYHRFYGVERLLHQQGKERRKMVTDGAQYKMPNVSKCIHPEKDKKCGLRVLPFTKYCAKHILDDHRQVLYRLCDSQDGPCSTPVVPVVNFGGTCLIHTNLPMLPTMTISFAPPVTSNVGEQIDPVSQASEDMCGLQAPDFSLGTSSDIPMYPDSASGTGSMGVVDIGSGLSVSQKDIWSQCLETPESKLRDELQSMDLTPGELPPEQLLATN